MSADSWGVSYGYNDGASQWHPAVDSTRASIRAAMGAPATSDSAPPESTAVIVATPARPFTASTSGVLHLENGGTLTILAGSGLPAETPFGYHSFDRADEIVSKVIVSPGQCFLPDNLKTWGWAVQLYAMRSTRSWGIGDFGDLRTLNDWSIKRGAGMVLVNPLHGAAPVISQQPSPYFPMTRVYRNPLYLNIEQIPGYGDVATELAPVAAKARALNEHRHIDRDEVFRAKYAAFDVLWERFRARTGAEQSSFAAYQAAEGNVLRDYATFCAYVETNPSSWFDWPESMKRPDASGVATFRNQSADRVQFHAWVQWLVDEQLREAGRGLALMTDLAIGCDRGGADGWMWPESFSLGMSVGAPPDQFNTLGQTWGLPPFDPWRLREAAYEPFIRTVRSAFRHAGALRIDHVMGMFRLYWIPEGLTAREGCYVYLPFADLLGIVALESHRAGAYVVGEDLGTIEPYVREELSSARILSYKLSQFEPGPAAEFTPSALAAVTTHDLATVTGAFTGSDLADQRSIGVAPNEAGMRQVRRDLAARAGFHDLPEIGEAPSGTQLLPTVDQVVAGVYADLATSPCAILTGTLDDALGVAERPNMPGTIDEWPNWRIALPVDLDTALADPRVANLATILNRSQQLPKRK
jgi:4-alpha-glucanotransferase